MKVLIVGILLCVSSLAAQDLIDNRTSGIEFLIHEEVTNADGAIEKRIIQLWQDYIDEGSFQDPHSPYWSFEHMKIPDENLWALGLSELKHKDYRVQCKIIGVFEVDHGYWSLISSFSHIDSIGEIHLDVITAVYAKEFEGEYLLVSSADYLKTIFEHRRVGSIDYYIHPFHQFVPEQATRMNEFNLKMSEEFGVAPLEFDYFAAANARDISRTWGYEYMNRMYNPSGKGGVASWRNMVIYSGNDSSYFPHELVHLYTYHIYPHDPHFWVGEGIATFYAGTSTYTFDGHMIKLKEFLLEHPDFDFSDITKLNTTIPNGEYKSDMRYVIGALLMKCIFDTYGVEGLIESLQYGTSDDDFFRLLQDKVGVTRASFDAYVKSQTLNYTSPD